jgi:hypothetical protein
MALAGSSQEGPVQSRGPFKHRRPACRQRAALGGTATAAAAQLRLPNMTDIRGEMGSCAMRRGPGIPPAKDGGWAAAPF